jgi:hypothetical protein
MEDFKNYFKFPLKMWEHMEIKVFTADNKMAFDWLVNIPRKTKESLIERINGFNTEPYKIPKKYWYEDGIVHCRILEGDNAGKEYKLFRIRGWGMLTGVGGYNLTGDVAATIQDTFAEYCVKMLNNNELA